MRYPGVLEYSIDVDTDLELEKIDNFRYKIKVKGEKGELEREFYYPNVWFEKKDNKLYIKSYWPSKREKRMMKTFLAHIKNMIKGVKDGYEYRLKIVYRHFPLKVEKKGNEIIIRNLIGSKDTLKAKILPGVDVEIKKDEIIVKGIDLEKVSQTAANIEEVTKRFANDKDKRKYYDGIYIYKKKDKYLVSDEILEEFGIKK